MSNVNFTVHDASGKILRVGSCPTNLVALQAKDGESVIETFSDLYLDYVAAGVVTPRPSNPATLAGMTISNLPIPSVIQINAASYPCTDNFAILTFTQPGTYAVTVKSWPYLDKSFSIVQP